MFGGRGRLACCAMRGINWIHFEYAIFRCGCFVVFRMVCSCLVVSRMICGCSVVVWVICGRLVGFWLTCCGRSSEILLARFYDNQSATRMTDWRSRTTNSADIKLIAERRTTYSLLDWTDAVVFAPLELFIFTRASATEEVAYVGEDVSVACLIGCLDVGLLQLIGYVSFDSINLLLYLVRIMRRLDRLIFICAGNCYSHEGHKKEEKERTSRFPRRESL